MKKLIVYWKHYSMSDSVAKKAVSQGGKTYKIEPRRSEFPPDKNPVEAMNEIYEEFGTKPESNPFKGVIVEHSFAEISGHKIIDVLEPEKQPVEKMEEIKLL